MLLCALIYIEELFFAGVITQRPSSNHFYCKRVKTVFKLQFFVILLKIVIIQNFSLVYITFKMVM